MHGKSGSRIRPCANPFGELKRVWWTLMGGGVIKQRIARPGRGRSGGYRVLIAVCWNDRAIFLFGFSKNERDTIKDNELKLLKKVALDWLAADEDRIELAIEEGELKEI